MPERPWSVPVAPHEIPDTGKRYELVADERVRTALAKLAGVRALPRVEAAFDVTRRGAGLHVVGRVSADVSQTCVVTLEPLDNTIDEPVDVVFVPDEGEVAGPEAGQGAGKKLDIDLDADDGPERMVGGVADLGAVATEFLLLGIDPYPRKAGAVFAAPQADDAVNNPFAALAALKATQGRNDR
jgi:hypothetical protein